MVIVFFFFSLCCVTFDAVNALKQEKVESGMEVVDLWLIRDELHLAWEVGESKR